MSRIRNESIAEEKEKEKERKKERENEREREREQVEKMGTKVLTRPGQDYDPLHPNERSFRMRSWCLFGE